MSYGDLLKYGVPVAGQLIGGLIQANAAGNESDAQQKYLEEALAYQKEQDLYNRGVAAAAVTKEAARYGDYTGRIAPWVANGTSANDRMAAVMGLPARSGGSSSGGSSSGGSQGVPVSADITAANLANYKSLGVGATGRGTGPTDSAYYDDQIAATGGLTDANKAYWFGPNGRIAQDMQKAGTARGTTPSDPVTTQPQARSADPSSGGTVQMRAPDNSIKTVSADQVAHYQQLGATVMGAA